MWVCALFPAGQARWEQLFCSGALSDLLAFARLGATGRRIQAASPSGCRSHAGGSHLSARPSRSPQVARVGRSRAPPRAVPANASPGRMPRAQAGSRARRRESAGRDRVGEPGELCWAVACGAAEPGLGGASGCGGRCAKPGGTQDSRSRRGAQLPTSGHAGAGRSCAGLPGTPLLEATTAEAGARPHGQVRASSRPYLCGVSSRRREPSLPLPGALLLLLNH